jgi:hypothetical protein
MLQYIREATPASLVRPPRQIRQDPIVNRRQAWNWFQWRRRCISEARAALDRGDGVTAARFILRARVAQAKGRVFQRRLAAQGGTL